MKFLFLLIIPLLVARSLMAQSGDAEVTARANALELAYAFANDGFKVRDAHFMATFSEPSGAVMDVSLYAGNDYWFLAGTGTRDHTLVVEVFDEQGRGLASTQYASSGRAAAGFRPEKSGRYFVRVRITDLGEGEVVPVCFLYSYR